MKGFISWNGFYYGYKELKNGNKYYKSKNVRFDGKEECTEKEYFEMAKKIC